MLNSVLKKLCVTSLLLCVSVSSVSAASVSEINSVPSDLQCVKDTGVEDSFTGGEFLSGGLKNPILGYTDLVDDPMYTENQEEVEVNNYVPTVTKTSLVNGRFAWLLKDDIIGKVSGVEYRVVNKKTGRTISRGVSYSTYNYVSVGKADVVYVSLRSFYYGDDGETIYSDWSSKKNNKAYALRHVSMKTKDTKKTIKKHSVTLKWNKVSGAKNYTIYGKQRSGKKWYKLKTTKNNYLKVTKINKKTINTVNTVEFKIVANTSVNGKTLSSAPFLCTVYLRVYG